MSWSEQWILHYNLVFRSPHPDYWTNLLETGSWIGIENLEDLFLLQELFCPSFGFSSQFILVELRDLSLSLLSILTLVVNVLISQYFVITCHRNVSFLLAISLTVVHLLWMKAEINLKFTIWFQTVNCNFEQVSIELLLCKVEQAVVWISPAQDCHTAIK
jgi:hypothetical protein